MKLCVKCLKSKDLSAFGYFVPAEAGVVCGACGDVSDGSLPPDSVGRVKLKPLPKRGGKR